MTESDKESLEENAEELLAEIIYNVLPATCEISDAYKVAHRLLCKGLINLEKFND